MSEIKGKISQVIGPVVDVRFEKEVALPNIFDALEVRKADGTTTANFPVQRQGYSAYSANSYYFDGTNDYLKATTIRPLMTDSWRDNGFCGEMWLHPLSASTDGVCSFIKVDDSNHLHMRFHDTHGFVVSFDSASGQVEILDSNNDEFCKGLVNSWYHVAVQITNADARSDQQLQLWINGNLFISASMSDKHFDASSAASAIFGWDDSNYYYGYMDSIRLSNKERINYTSSNAKLGTKAVHHSNAKLLITSNTFSGNTQFDDFADQGNYWNQQPSSYFFDGTNDYIDVGGFPQTGVVYSVYAVWFKASKDATGSEALIASRGGGGGHNAYWINISQDDGRLGSVSEGGTGYSEGWNWVYSDSKHFAHGDWNLATMVHDGTTSVKIYGNGILEGTQSTVAGTSMASGTYTSGYRIGDEEGTSYNFHGQIAQVGAWRYDSSSALTTKWTDSAHQALWELGPTGNWMTDYSDNLLSYFTMGNHNDLGGRPADTASTVYDRSGNGNDGTTAGSMNAPAKGLGGAITNQGTVKHSTDNKKFGSSALYFPGANPDYLTMPDKTLPYFANSDWTIEAWIWFNKSSTGTLISKTASTTYGQIRIDISNVGLVTAYMSYNSSSNFYVNNDGNPITLGSWHHLAVQRKNNVNGEMYIDGILSGHKEMSGSLISNTDQWEIGRLDGTNHYVYQGYVDELGIIVGTAKYNPVVTGLGTATVTPGILPDPTGNHFTPTGLAITDQMLDSPENNFCTWNPLDVAGGDNTFSEGNLKLVVAAQSSAEETRGTFGFTTGKWYFEVKLISTTTTAGYFNIGFKSDDLLKYWRVRGSDGETETTGGTQTTVAVSYTTGDIVGVLLDMDNGKWYVTVNGVMQNSGIAIHSNLTGTVHPYVFNATSAGTHTIQANFGQGDPDGENNFADSNGRGGFRHEPSQGYLAMCTANLKDADYAPIGPNSAAGTPDKHFDTVLYTGNGWDGTGSPDAGDPHQFVGGLNFKPDLIWIKARDQGYPNQLVDTVRGIDKVLDSGDTTVSAAVAEGPETAVAEVSDGGFEVGGQGYFNRLNTNYVAWCWKAGNGTTENFDGTIASTVSVNQDAGFSIVSYTGNATEGATVGHGLSQAPEIIFVKNLDSAENWAVYALDGQSTLFLNLDNGESTSDYTFDSTNTTSTVIQLGSGDLTNHNIERNIAYCWHSVEGYSKFGTYIGNGNADGPFVYTGFRPALIIFKRTNTAGSSWGMIDNKRDTDNPVGQHLYPDNPVAENTNAYGDFLSNGFKIRSTSGFHNTDTHTHVYMAFAEMPFKYANAR